MCARRKYSHQAQSAESSVSNTTPGFGKTYGASAVQTRSAADLVLASLASQRNRQPSAFNMAPASAVTAPVPNQWQPLASTSLDSHSAAFTSTHTLGSDQWQPVASTSTRALASHSVASTSRRTLLSDQWQPHASTSIHTSDSYLPPNIGDWEATGTRNNDLFSFPANNEQSIGMGNDGNTRKFIPNNVSKHLLIFLPVFDLSFETPTYLLQDNWDEQAFRNPDAHQGNVDDNWDL